MTCPARKFLERVGLTTAGVGLRFSPRCWKPILVSPRCRSAHSAETNAKVRFSLWLREPLPHVRRRGKSHCCAESCDRSRHHIPRHRLRYGDGKSESRVGKVMATRRKDVWLAHKNSRSHARPPSFGASKAASLACKPILDLVTSTASAKPTISKNRSPGWRAQGLAGSSRAETHAVHRHDQPHKWRSLATAIQRYDLDCVQMALNASRNGRFEELALPAADAKKSRHYRHEGHWPGVSPRQRRRQSRHRFTAALIP